MGKLLILVLVGLVAYFLWRGLRRDGEASRKPPRRRRTHGGLQPVRRAPAGLRGSRGEGPVLLLRRAPSAVQRLNKPAAPELAAFRAHAQQVEPREPQAAPDSFWVSLRYFNVYRIAIAALFLASALVYGDALNLGSHDLRLFTAAAAAYLAAAVAFQVALKRAPRSFDTHLTTHICTDIAATVLLMYASGGFRSGLGVMLLISLAAAALVSRGRLLLFYAALATIAVLRGAGLLESSLSTSSVGDLPASRRCSRSATSPPRSSPTSSRSA